MSATLGTSVGNKSVVDIFVGTSSGNKRVKSVYIGTSTGNRLVWEDFKKICYTWDINDELSDPSQKVTYTGENKDFTPAGMNFDSDKFNYGSWEEAFFMPKPCVLNFDGTVAFYLDPNNYRKKIDGTNWIWQDDTTNNSNVMIQFPKMYFYRKTEGKIHHLGVANYKVNDDYHCYAHLDANGNEIPYIYLPAYLGYLDINNVMRSFPDKAIKSNMSVNSLITYVGNNNNVGSVENIWFPESWSERCMINDLLVLISKNTNTQAIFGMGNVENMSNIVSGVYDEKGLFYGRTDRKTSVKVFGLQDWWGNYNRVIEGIGFNDGLYTKMTYNEKDGTTAVGYNVECNGYIKQENYSSGEIISEMNYSDNGCICTDATGIDITGYCDKIILPDSGLGYFATVGGDITDGTNAGAFYLNLSESSTTTVRANTSIGVCCKPLAKVN